MAVEYRSTLPLHKKFEKLSFQYEVCSRHFTNDDFIIGGNIRKLKKCAIPNTLRLEPSCSDTQDWPTATAIDTYEQMEHVPHHEAVETLSRNTKLSRSTDPLTEVSMSWSNRSGNRSGVNTKVNAFTPVCSNLSKVQSHAEDQLNTFTSSTPNTSQVSVDSGMSSCPSTPSTPSSPVDIDIKIATKDDAKAMREFLFKFFFKDEPLNKCTNLLANGDDSTLTELEMFSLKEVDNGQCVLALHNGKLIGVAINAILERNWLEKEDEFKIENPTFKKITTLLDYVAKESDPFKKFVDCDKAMTIKIISVDDTYRGKGIAKQLMTKTREMAKASGCGFMTVDCTSHFTASALKKLGFQLHYSLNYSDYKVDGKVLFEPEPPHKAVTVYTQKL